MIDARFTNRRKHSSWFTCDRCGVDYPLAGVVVQRGMVLCQGSNTNNCVDEPGADYYRKRISVIERLDPNPPSVGGDDD